MDKNNNAQSQHNRPHFGLILALMTEGLAISEYPEMVRVANIAESYGFSSVWLCDHFLTLSPDDYVRHAGISGGDGQRQEKTRPATMPLLEAWTALSALARDTTNIRLGTSVLCNSYRHPAVLAKMAATSAQHLEYYAGFAGKTEGSYQDLGPRFNYVRREPYGVIGQIVPWNTPLKLMARGFAAAVACGNTMVVKPSVVAPLSVLRFAKTVHEAGFPTGSVNIITGSGRTVGKAIVEHPQVRKIIFTGGTEGGHEILQQAVHTVTPAVLELGGKGPIIVCEDVDWNEAIDGVLTQAFARKAEVCFAGTRLFVPASMHDQFIADLAAKAAKIPMGNPLDDRTQLGPLMSSERLTDILEKIDKARADGATIYCGGDKVRQPRLEKGNFLPPTILTDVTPRMSVARDELFGPVLCAMAYGELADAVAMANDSDYGLASYVWSNDIRKSTKIANALESGNVFINSYGYQSEIPFGGYKMSGIGREHGGEAIHEYTQAKSITVGLDRFKSRFEVGPSFR